MLINILLVPREGGTIGRNKLLMFIFRGGSCGAKSGYI